MNLNPKVNPSVSDKKNEIEQIRVFKRFIVRTVFIWNLKISKYKKTRYLENKKKIAEAKHLLENQKNEIAELYDSVKKSTENSLSNKRLNMILHKAINEKIDSFTKDIENTGYAISNEYTQKKQDNTSNQYFQK